MHLSRVEIDQLVRRKRANLINSITGIKPANLIGSQSSDGLRNLAIFNSVIHLGSNPPLIGMVVRPVGEVRRDTYANIKENGCYTINAVPVDKTKEAHFTSAKFDQGESEFEACGFQPVYVEGFPAPFVAESPIRFGLRLVQEIPIELNGTLFIIGEVEHLYVQEELISEEGYLNLDQAQIAGISGLNTYYDLSLKAIYPYAKKEDLLSK